MKAIRTGVAVTAALASTAFATEMKIDFTSSYYESFVDGKQCSGWFGVENGDGLKIRVTAVPEDKVLTWNDSEGFSTGDGLGVGDDEVKGTSQKLQIEFDRAVRVESIELLDLYYEKDNAKVAAWNEETPGGYTEIGHFTVAGGETVSFIADIPESEADLAYMYGYKKVEVGSAVWTNRVIVESQYDKVYGTDISTIVPYTVRSGNNDYAFASMKVQVPEPGSVSMLGAGLVMLLGSMGLSRRRKTVGK